MTATKRRNVKAQPVTATFPKGRDHHTTSAIFVWADGFKATMPIGNARLRVPHDLEHFVVEVRLRPAYGFWNLLSQKAPFSSLTPMRPWPQERVEWYRLEYRKHQTDTTEAEVLASPVFDAANSPEPYHWPSVQKSLARNYTTKRVHPLANMERSRFDELVEAYRELLVQWDALPEGGALVVRWPSADLESVVLAPT